MLRHLIRRPDSRPEDGFTLLELLAVIGIMGVMTAIAVPSISNQMSHKEDRKTQQTVILIADELKEEAKKNSVKSRATLESLRNYNFTNLSVGTVVSLDRTADKNAWCLSVYNPSTKGSYADINTALQYDAKDIFAEYKTTCDSQRITLNETYVVSDVNRQLVPTIQDRAPSACGSVDLENTSMEYTASENFRSDTGLDLEGHFTMNSTCTAIDYNLRVKNAQADTNYVVNPQVVLDNPVTPYRLGAETLVIKGEERIHGSIETTLTPDFNGHYISLEGVSIRSSTPTWVVGN